MKELPFDSPCMELVDWVKEEVLNQSWELPLVPGEGGDDWELPIDPVG